MERLHAVVEGYVQGVGFRNFVQAQAVSLGLTGWVRNVYDTGSVELAAEGERAQLEALLERVRRGPRSSRVTAVNADWEAATGEFSDFRIAISSY